MTARHGPTRWPWNVNAGSPIKSAVVSFVVDGVTINLIDTPGHPDFIAEVETRPRRARRRSARRVGGRGRAGPDAGAVPCPAPARGADDRVREQAGPRGRRRQRDARRHRRSSRRRRPRDDDAVGRGHRSSHGGRTTHGRPGVRRGGHGRAGRQRRHDPAALRGGVGDRARPTAPGDRRPDGAVAGGARVLRRRLEGRRRRRRPAHDLHPAARGRRGARGAGVGNGVQDRTWPSGERIALVRMFAGTLRTRDRVRFGDAVDTVTGIEVFDQGTTHRRAATHGGEIAKVHGLAAARIGAAFGPAARRVGDQASPHRRWRRRSSPGRPASSRPCSMRWPSSPSRTR